LRLRFDEWFYVNLTLAAFVFAPEMHRIAGGVDSSKVLLAIPTLMLVPIGFFVFKRRAAMPRTGFLTVSTVWSGAFLYAFIIGIVSNWLVPGVYALGLFVLPVLVGAWIVVSPGNLLDAFRRFSDALFLYGTLAGLYGIFQFVTAPPWDTAWMQSVDAGSFGTPAPYEIRVFSVMNGPGIYAVFTACSLILSLPKIRLSRPWFVLAAFIMIVGLLLSLVRSAWLAVAIGVAVFALISPYRTRAIASLLTVAGIFAIIAAAFFTFVPNESVENLIVNRIGTLADIGEDNSTVGREQTSRAALGSGLANPFGHGLGTTGQAAALATTSASELSDIPDGAIDNGFVSRFVEMGIPGLVTFLISIFLALMFTYRRLRDYRRRGCLEEAAILAAAFATQLAIFLITASGDVYAGIGSLLFFIAFGLATKGSDDTLPMSPAPVSSDHTFRNSLPRNSSAPVF
jgi:uncharacterized membrane protein YhaH (DUF805 family)